MKQLVLISLLFGLLVFHIPARADGNCPPGYYSIGGQGVQGCAPLPGYDQQQPQAPAAPSPRWESRWGAIAMGTDGVRGVLGANTGMSSKAAAEQGAMADCANKGGSLCRVQVSYANGCGVVVVGNPGFNAGNAATIDDAAREGMKVCKEAGATDCHVYYSACSLPQRIQ
ncbi:DUF4189 domain-containing protein [Dyella sp.]|uniref:DUF4189 domain-containing protein n=1 Tax=Dyella sp. TaxID=1869338 RepID=UPI002FDA1901